MSAPARKHAPAPTAKPVAGPRAPTTQQVVADPNICIKDRWKVLQRTDSVWIVYDELAPLGKRTVDTAKSRDAARAAAEHLARGWEP